MSAEGDADPTLTLTRPPPPAAVAAAPLSASLPPSAPWRRRQMTRCQMTLRHPSPRPPRKPRPSSQVCRRPAASGAAVRATAGTTRAQGNCPLWAVASEGRWPPLRRLHAAPSSISTMIPNKEHMAYRLVRPSVYKHGPAISETGVSAMRLSFGLRRRLRLGIRVRVRLRLRFGRRCRLRLRLRFGLRLGLSRARVGASPAPQMSAARRCG